MDKAHPYRLALQHKLAQTYLLNRRAPEAITLLQNIVDTQKRVLDKAHHKLYHPSMNLR